MTSAIEAAGLGKRYGRRWALQDCTVTIPAGRVVGLVGANGAGKTTLLHLVVGLLSPSAGSVSVLGAGAGDGPTSSRGWAFLHKTPRCTQPSRSVTIFGSDKS